MLKEKEKQKNLFMVRCAKIHGESTCNRMICFAVKKIKEADIVRMTGLSRWTVRYWIKKILD